MSNTKWTIPQILSLLEKQYGRVAEPRERRSPLAELVLTVLSQNTSDVNSHRAYQSLVSHFVSWEKLATARTGAIERAIRAGGLEHIKAARLKAILEQIQEERGNLDLSFLSEMPLDEARDWLRRLPGVGPKTAACVLLFSLGMPALPVDTHVHRVATRLGLLQSKVSAERAHDIMLSLVSAREVYRFHMLFIEHGRTLCKAQRPLCHVCPLLKGCPTGATLVKSKEG